MLAVDAANGPLITPYRLPGLSPRQGWGHRAKSNLEQKKAPRRHIGKGLKVEGGPLPLRDSKRGRDSIRFRLATSADPNLAGRGVLLVIWRGARESGPVPVLAELK